MPIPTLVVGMTWDENILRWWMMNDKSAPPTPRHSSNEWQELKKQFEELNIYPGHLHLPNYNEDDFFHEVFYGIFKV